MRLSRLLALTLLMASVLTVPLEGSAAAAELPPGGTFVDDNGSVHEGNIEAIAAAGITRGCNPPLNDRYCPTESLTRGQMAAFVRRALDLPPSSVDYFDDDDDSVFQDDINAIAKAGITRGCNPPENDRFCHEDPVTREQMAGFLQRAFRFPLATEDYFDDDSGSIFADDINALAKAGVTTGCSSSSSRLFCPWELVRRDQMASFYARALGLKPIVPPAACSIFPSDNIWNQRVDRLPVHPRSAQFIEAIGTAPTLHANFGSGVWPPGSNRPIGIPYVEVTSRQPMVDIEYTKYGRESDKGPFPIPPNAPIEEGPDSSGDRHVIVVDREACMLYELYEAHPQSDGSWHASSGAKYDLESNALRPNGWTSADAAGLPIFPGLVTYDEVASGVITHAIRFTAPETRAEHVWPARHHSSGFSASNYPPMGQRFRLKAGFDISGFSPQVRVILQAFKDYGLILADNGAPWSISGAPDPRWDNRMLHEWDGIPGSAFEAVDVSSLIVDPDSGATSD